MNAPAYNGEPGALFSDREHDRRPEPSASALRCDDCHGDIYQGARSSPLWLLCADCYGWRKDRGLHTDPRPKTALLAELRGAA